MIPFEIRSLHAGLLTTAALAISLGTAQPAAAQLFGGFFGGGGEAPVAREGVIPPRFVAGILRAQGFRMTDLPIRRGNRIIALGVDERGQMMRFVLDAYDGALIRTALVGAPRPPGYVGERNDYAYGAPTLPDERGGALDREPAPAPAKPKPRRAKVAAKPPAAVLPGVAPASPAPLPSKPPAIVAPIPVAPSAPPPPAASIMPAAPPPAASIAPIAPRPIEPTIAAPTMPERKPLAARPANAPEMRAAPDAQPGDIGPKVVPVKPSQARAPEAESAPAPAAASPAPIAPPASSQ